MSKQSNSEGDIAFAISNHPRCNERLRQLLRCLRDLLNDNTPVPNKVRSRRIAQKYPALPAWLIAIALILASGRSPGRPPVSNPYS
jgi:hypothetical protein